MNRLTFKDGGQPVYLDDLKLLQQNHDEMCSSILGEIIGDSGAMLLKPVTLRTISSNMENLSITVEVSAGTLIADGGLCHFTQTQIVQKKDDDIYICLKKSETDLRTFADGQDRHCREEITAHISTDTIGAYKFYKLSELNPLLEQMKIAMENVTNYEDIDIAFGNGYHGSFQVKKIDNGNDWLFTLNITTSEKEWKNEKGLLFRIYDHAMAQLLTGRRSPNMTLDGKKYHLGFSYNNDPFCYLAPDGVEDILAPEVVIPLIPIVFSWRNSEMKTY